MGNLEPDDSRDVTLNPNTAPGEPPRTGPREGETRKDQPGRGKNGQQHTDGENTTGAQGGYGNARDQDGAREQDQLGENDQTQNDQTSAGAAMNEEDEVLVTAPDGVARADANRPL